MEILGITCLLAGCSPVARLRHADVDHTSGRRLSWSIKFHTWTAREMGAFPRRRDNRISDFKPTPFIRAHAYPRARRWVRGGPPQTPTPRKARQVCWTPPRRTLPTSKRISPMRAADPPLELFKALNARGNAHL